MVKQFILIIILFHFTVNGYAWKQNLLTTNDSGNIRVYSDFPGGSASIKSIDQKTLTIRLVPEVNPDKGWECWWYFRVEGLEPGTTIIFEVGANGFGLPDRPQFSYDNKTWSHGEPGERKGRLLMIYHHTVTASKIWFAWGPPFLLEHANELIKKISKSRYAKKFELTKSIEGRSVPALELSQKGVADKDRLVIWIQARQHAWEIGGSWVGRGLIEWLISKDTLAEALRKKALIYFIPVMDVDNVELGAGGKNQKPQDHYWDWSASPHFPEVRAAMNKIKGFISDGRFKFFMDLHNPGAGNKEILFYVPARPLLIPERVKMQNDFFEIAKKEMDGPTGFKGALGPIGNTYDPITEPACDCWIANKTNNTNLDVLALTMEIPWNVAEGTQEGYMKKGVQLGRTLAIYINKTIADKQ